MVIPEDIFYHHIKIRVPGERTIFVHAHKMRGAGYKLGGAKFKCPCKPNERKIKVVAAHLKRLLKL